jgi:hypothetical protein
MHDNRSHHIICARGAHVVASFSVNSLTHRKRPRVRISSALPAGGLALKPAGRKAFDRLAKGQHAATGILLLLSYGMTLLAGVSCIRKTAYQPQI